MSEVPVEALPGEPSLLGESPFWHPAEAALYWCDIAGRRVHRWREADASHAQWDVDSEPGCCAPLLGGGLLLAQRDGLWRLDTASGRRERLAAPPYDPARQRFNDGRADPQGRLWVATLDDARAPEAALYRFARGRLERITGGITVGNGLAFSPDGRTLYLADTTAHRIRAFDFDGHDGSLSRARTFAEFPARQEGQPLAAYGGRPDGAAVDASGAYWVAMYEGARLLRLSPEGDVMASVALPVRCPTMPCFGGHDLRTLFVTTARHKRPAEELAREPDAGRVLRLRVDVPGMPVHFATP